MASLHSFITYMTIPFYLTCRCIQIRNLHKVYATKKGNCCAVNSLQLTLYENQILALLGECILLYFFHLSVYFIVDILNCLIPKTQVMVLIRCFLFEFLIV